MRSFKKGRLCKDRTILSRRSDIEMENRTFGSKSSKKILDTTWIDVKSAENSISEVLFCIRPLQIPEKLAYCCTVTSNFGLWTSFRKHVLPQPVCTSVFTTRRVARFQTQTQPCNHFYWTVYRYPQESPKLVYNSTTQLEKQTPSHRQ